MFVVLCISRYRFDWIKSKLLFAPMYCLVVLEKKKSSSCTSFYHNITCTMIYCKRCYFRVTKFSRLAAQKHIRGLLNSRWADAHLSFWYCTMLTSFNEWYIYMYVCNWAAQKQSRSQTDLSITHLHQHIMVNTQLLRVQNVHTKYCKYFRGFLNSRLLNLREIREN